MTDMLLSEKCRGAVKTLQVVRRYGTMLWWCVNTARWCVDTARCCGGVKTQQGGA